MRSAEIYAWHRNTIFDWLSAILFILSRLHLVCVFMCFLSCSSAMFFSLRCCCCRHRSSSLPVFLCFSLCLCVLFVFLFPFASLQIELQRAWKRPRTAAYMIRTSLFFWQISKVDFIFGTSFIVCLLFYARLSKVGLIACTLFNVFTSLLSLSSRPLKVLSNALNWLLLRQATRSTLSSREDKNKHVCKAKLERADASGAN